MESNIKIFEKAEFGSVRVMELDGVPMFVGKDVATILGHANPAEAINEHTDSKERKTLTFKTYSKTLQASL
jgi:prophage antirepressor-like protein